MNCNANVCNQIKDTLNAHERYKTLTPLKLTKPTVNAILMVHVNCVNKSGFCLSRDVWVIFNCVCIAIVSLYIACIGAQKRLDFNNLLT